MTFVATLACLLPLLLGGIFLLAMPRLRFGNAPRLAPGFAAVSFIAAVGCAVLVIATASGSFSVGVLSLHLDAIGAVFALVIGFVGLVIVQFSAGYLAGEPRQPTFLGLLLLTLFFAQLLAMAGDVIVFGLAWVGMSLPVQKLLTYYQRPGAVLASRLKFAFARCSDLVLFAALGLLVAATGASSLAAICTIADAASPLVTGAAVLLTLAILLRSAQVPTHAWLLRAIEAPTPVSAVLHAGVVNAGGLLALRFAPVLGANGLAMTLLAVASGFSVLVALGAMAGEQRLKSRLAWSTVAQMGFMLLQCSLGLWGLALLHLAAHALYKSFAFLNAGTLVPVRSPVAASWSGVLATVVTFAVVAFVASPLVRLDTASLVIGAVFVLGLGLFGATAGSLAAIFARIAAGAAATAIWLGLHEVAPHLVPTSAALAGPLVAVAAVVAVAALAGLVANSPLRNMAAIKSLGLHLRNGLYIDLVVERLAQARVAAALPETAK